MIFVIMSYLYFIEDLTPPGAEPQLRGPGSAPGLDGAAAAADLGQGRAPHTARRPRRQRQRRQRQRGDPGAGGADGAGTAGICQLGMLRMRFGFWVKIGEHPAIDHPDSSTGFQDSRIPLIHPFVENIEELVELVDGWWIGCKSRRMIVPADPGSSGSALLERFSQRCCMIRTCPKRSAQSSDQKRMELRLWVRECMWLILGCGWFRWMNSDEASHLLVFGSVTSCGWTLKRSIDSSRGIPKWIPEDNKSSCQKRLYSSCS